MKLIRLTKSDANQKVHGIPHKCLLWLGRANPAPGLACNDETPHKRSTDPSKTYKLFTRTQEEQFGQHKF